MTTLLVEWLFRINWCVIQILQLLYVLSPTFQQTCFVATTCELNVAINSFYSFYSKKYMVRVAIDHFAWRLQGFYSQPQ